MVQSLLKALNLLALFTREKPELRLTEICALLQIPASTAHRLLRTLEKQDFITQNNENGKYLLGAAAFVTGTNVSNINRLVETALPFIAELATKYNATAHVAIEQNNHVLCVEKIESPTSIVNSPPRGVRHKLHLTSVGKCIMAFSSSAKQEELLKHIEFTPGLPMPASIGSMEALEKELRKVKRQGYAIDACESAEGLYCFGAPVLGENMQMVSAISVSCNSQSYPDSATSIIRDVQASAKEITHLLAQEPTSLVRFVTPT